MADTRQVARWVLRAQVGDREALDRLLESVQEPLYRCLRGIVRDEHTVRDVLQDVFVLICRKLRWLREPAVFRPWCFRIATREALRRLKRTQRREAMIDRSVDPKELPGAAALPASDEEVRHMMEKLDTVSPASRAVLVLHYLDGMSLQQTADVLGVPVGTVKSRLTYGLATMRKRLGETV